MIQRSSFDKHCIIMHNLIFTKRVCYFFNISATAAMLPKDEIASLGNINLLAGFLDISVKASTCFKAITVSLSKILI